MNWNIEMIEKAKAAASVEELLEIAKANAVELTPAEAATYFAQLNPVTGELSDDDLDAVSGGACSDGSWNADVNAAFDAVRQLNCPQCGRNDKWDMTGYSNGKNYWQCCACGKNVHTLDSEGNTVLH